MIAPVFSESCLAPSSVLRVHDLEERERKASVFVTGWAEREALGARHGDYRNGYSRSEDHAQRVA